MLTMEQARERVARGAKLLDEKRPGWAHEINIGRLDLGDSCWCVLGQLEGDFTGAAVSWWQEHSFAESDKYGFAIREQLAAIWASSKREPFLSQYQLLQDAWIEEIAARVVTPEPIPVTVES